MAVNIDWSLASTPNILGAYTGAREKAEQNALLQQQQAAQVTQTARVNAREDTRLSMEQQKATRDQATSEAQGWQKAALTVSHLKGVLGTAGPEAAVAAFDQISPGLGLSPEQSQAMRTNLAQDPQGFLDHVGALAEQKLQFINLGDGGVAVGDQNTGSLKTLRDPAPKYQAFKTDENVYQVGGAATPAGAPQAAATATPAPKGGVYDQVASLATQNGAQPQDVTYLQRLAQVESGGNPKATNGKSTGVFQFHPDTFAGVGGGNINDVGDQTKAALALSQRDRQILTQNKLDPTDANTYIMHQQGAAGGKALLTAPPETNAIAALTPIYGSEKIARKAIVNNGGTADMTAGQFTDMWRQKWGGGQQQAAAPQTAPSGLKLVQAAQASPDDDAVLSPDAVSLLAGRYLKDGTLPPLGMGKAAAANRNAILNAATSQAKSLGIDANDLVAGNLSVKAAGAALSKATSQRAAVESFENTAVKNADLMLSLAPKGGGPTNSPVVNRWIQGGRKQIAGDPDVGNFDIALGTFADEYAKIVSGATGAQGSTDASRREAYDRLSKYASQGQLQGGIATMKQEMHNRITSMRDTEDGLRSQIRNTGGVEPTAAPPAAALRTSAVATRQAMSQNQRSAAGRFAGSKDPVGSVGNPYVTISEAQYKNLPSGAHYLFTDGKVLVKP